MEHISIELCPFTSAVEWCCTYNGTACIVISEVMETLKEDYSELRVIGDAGERVLNGHIVNCFCAE